MKKPLIFSLVAMLVFGLMGVGFAMWADQVTVSASVETGTVQAGIRDIGTNDSAMSSKMFNGEVIGDVDGDTVDDSGVDPQITDVFDSTADVTGNYSLGYTLSNWDKILNNDNKNVARCVSFNGSASLTSDDFSGIAGTFNNTAWSGSDTSTFVLNDITYGPTITEMIGNAYPYYAPTTKFELACNGSIPVKIDDIVLLNNDNDNTTATELEDILPGMHLYWNLTGNVNGGSDVTTLTDGPATTGYSLSSLVSTLEGLQLHEGDVLTVEWTTWFDQSTEQDQDVSYTIKIHACQWNEYGADIPTSGTAGDVEWYEDGYANPFDEM